MTKIFGFFALLFFTLPLSAQQTVGLFQNDSTAFNGYTLFAPTSSTTTYLIDNCGALVHSWSSNYRPGQSAYLLPDGRLLRTGRINGFMGGGTGGRIELFNWEGELTWAYDYSADNYHQHHDVEYLPNGHILVIAWEAFSEAEAIAAGRNPALISNNGELWAEKIVEIEPVGNDEINIVWEWHLWDHLIQDFDSSQANYGIVAEHPELLNINFTENAGNGSSDWIHINSIDYNPELDQIVLSSRHLNEFWIIDHSTSTEEAASHSGGNSEKGGDLLYRWGNPQSYNSGTDADQRLFGQHDVQWIPAGMPDEGKIMLFNNGLNRPAGNYSSIDILSIPTDVEGNYFIDTNGTYGPSELFWTYSEDPGFEFYSSRISGCQRLPNGNTLICEGIEGHFFEVDQEGHQVWDYISPIRQGNPVPQGTNINQNDVFRAYRYGPDYDAFIDKDLNPGDPIELEPLPSVCEVEDSVMTSIPILTAIPGIQLMNNPVWDELRIQNDLAETIHLKLFGLDGKVWYSERAGDQTIEIDVQNWPDGVYVLQVFCPGTNSFFVQKVVKQ